ncbi:MAG TPA: hypothetical protein VLV16_00655 [Gemmatimonadales bacterium]|nr:hypothetical protein [Gemmatimonadales bacterium]
MSTFFRSRLFLVVGLMPVVASGQSTPRDTTPFHRGQWGAQFGVGLAFASLGFLRFTTPTRAWLLDVRVNGGHSHESSYQSDTVVSDGYSSSAVLSARVGRRFYQARGATIASFQTVGVVGGYTHQCSGSTDAPSYCDNGWTAGAFVELGAAYLVSSRLSLGGAATASFAYERANGHDSGGGRTTHWEYTGSLQGFSLAATVYF